MALSPPGGDRHATVVEGVKSISVIRIMGDCYARTARSVLWLLGSETSHRRKNRMKQSEVKEMEKDERKCGNCAMYLTDEDTEGNATEFHHDVKVETGFCAIRDLFYTIENDYAPCSDWIKE